MNQRSPFNENWAYITYAVVKNCTQILPVQIAQRGETDIAGTVCGIGIPSHADGATLQCLDSGISNPKDAADELAGARGNRLGHTVAVVIHVGCHLGPEHALVVHSDLYIQDNKKI